MGFSVSGAAAIIFASLFIAVGMFYSAGMDSFERVTDAQEDRADTVLETRNTEAEIVNATFNATGRDNLTVRIENRGTAQLSVSDTDLLVDGTYVANDDWNESTVAGNSGTDLWLSGEQLTINDTRSSAPDRVKVVADTGVSDTSDVEDLSP